MEHAASHNNQPHPRAPTTMNDPPQLLRPVRNTSGGQSPSRQPQRVSDDILAHTTPATAVDALASATSGPLRTCLDEASAAEREFAMRTAVASRTIWEWVDELRDWPWPSEGGSAGFEAPGGERRRLFVEVPAPGGEDSQYIGSLPAEDVARYEERIDEIYRDMEELAVEEIKSHVMTNHIMPLSRPTTPMSDAGRYAVPSYNKMEDLTAVITATVVQALPNLARLYRLLHMWSIRVGVLQKVPSVLRSIGNAEVALSSGWTAISSPPRKAEGHEPQVHEATLSRKDFDVMKTVIEKKVSIPGRTLDYMLDCLEGMSDTLPDEWLDRMEAVERGYGEWVASCERKMRASEWAKASRSVSQPNGSADGSARVKRPDAGDAVNLPVPAETEGVGEPSKKSRDARKASGTANGSPAEELPELVLSMDTPPMDMDSSDDDFSSSRVQIPTPIKEEQSPSPDKSKQKLPNWNVEDAICTAEELGPTNEPELPLLPTEGRRGSNASNDSTVLHGASSQFGLSSDPPEVSASPEISKARVREAEYVGVSPPSSPPLPEPDARESSTAPEKSTEDSALEDSAIPKTPLDSSFSEFLDDSISTSALGSPSVRRESTGDQQLRQQISEIIDSIPAKIKLTAEPPNLNPPDLQLPRLRKKPSKEPFKRSVSSMSNMSSRTATPSFTLSPAKNSRPRHQRGQQEIKVYHLSRSTGEAPIKLFIRCVGENGERVMVRVGGGWADLSEYLKDYASHHKRRSGATKDPKIEVRDAPRGFQGRGGTEAKSSPPSRPSSSLETSPMTPLSVRKTRRSTSAVGSEAPRLRPNTPAPPPPPQPADDLAQSSEERATRSRSSSRLSWVEDDSSFLGLAGPTGKKFEMSEENKAWVESVKEKVRLASGERKVSAPEEYNKNKFGELGRVGGTKRLFRRPEGQIQGQRDTNTKK